VENLGASFSLAEPATRLADKDPGSRAEQSVDPISILRRRLAGKAGRRELRERDGRFLVLPVRIELTTSPLPRERFGFSYSSDFK
jgi:hypothetical protein